MLQDTNVDGYGKILSPSEVQEKVPLSPETKQSVETYRHVLKNIVLGEDKRKVLIVGPCSIHNVDEAIEYAKKLRELSDKVLDKVFLVMRLYFEKPRTTTGWKGLISDPFLDDSFNMEEGIIKARKLLIEVAELGIPAGTEFLDPIVPQYISELLCWAAIGARTTESQTHRQMASGLSMPVGFKNATNGDVDIAINSLASCGSPHSFLGIGKDGRVSRVNTKGNKYGHIILRGGKEPNYDKESVALVQSKCKEKGANAGVIIDCSHGNSYKDYKKQSIAFRDVIGQLPNNPEVLGMMLESNLSEGNQKMSDNLEKGVSITDQCIGWEETEELIMELYNSL